MSDSIDLTHCVECDHPGSHHDAGECWTDSQGREVSGGSVCGCGWYTPRYAVGNLPESTCPICRQRPRDTKTRNSPTGYWCMPCQDEFDNIDWGAQ